MTEVESSDLSRYSFGGSEFRGLSNLEKAVLLCCAKKMTIIEAAAFWGVTKSAVGRGCIAWRENRESNKEAFNITLTDNGWMTGATFKTVIEEWFVKEIDRIREERGLMGRWAMLVVDNHSSRPALENSEFFKARRVIIFELPPHSSTLLQPLDLGPNLILKQQYAKWYQPEGISNADQRRNDQLDAIRLALSQATCESVTRWAWKRSGLWPVRFEQISRSDFIKPEHEKIPAGFKKPKKQKLKVGQVLLGDGKIINWDDEDKENYPPKKQKKKKKQDENNI